MTVNDLLVLICMAMVALGAAIDIAERIERRIKSKRRSQNKE